MRILLTLLLTLTASCTTTTKLQQTSQSPFSPLSEKEIEAISSGDKAVWWKHYESNRTFYLALFNATEQRDTFEKQLRAQLEEYDLDELKKRIQNNRARVSKSFQSSLAELLKALNETKPLTVYEVIFFHPFNGKGFLLRDEPVLAVNIAFSNLGSENDLQLLAYHEGFHGVHMRRIGPEESRRLFATGTGVAWREGLAVLATTRLLPKLLPRQVVALKEDDFLKCKENLVSYSGDLADQLPNQERTNRNFFSSRPLLPQYIPRCGFYLSWQALERLEDDEKDLQQLMGLTSKDSDTLINDTLTEQGKVEQAARKKRFRRRRR